MDTNLGCSSLQLVHFTCRDTPPIAAASYSVVAQQANLEEVVKVVRRGHQIRDIVQFGFDEEGEALGAAIAVSDHESFEAMPSFRTGRLTTMMSQFEEKETEISYREEQLHLGR